MDGKKALHLGEELPQKDEVHPMQHNQISIFFINMYEDPKKMEEPVIQFLVLPLQCFFFNYLGLLKGGGVLKINVSVKFLINAGPELLY